MHNKPFRAIVLASAACAMAGLFATPADAQKKDKADAPIGRTPDSLKPHPELWPRLDPGAVFCDTLAALDRHFDVVNAKLDGSSNPPPEPAGCRTVRTQTAISVVSRASSGHTQVKLSREPGSVGWTDAFLPDKDPVNQKPSNKAAPGF